MNKLTIDEHIITQIMSFDEQRLRGVYKLTQTWKVDPASLQQVAKELNINVTDLYNRQVRKTINIQLRERMRFFNQKGVEKTQAFQLLKAEQAPARNPKITIPREFNVTVKSRDFLLLSLSNPGIATQLNPDAEHENEITIGLDFGTSSVKVIVRDLNGNTFLVPFGSTKGTQGSYLLPARLYRKSGSYSLQKGDQVLRDLKLSLMKQPDQEDHQIHATAFLALVLRHVRGWLFENYSDLYKSEFLIWGMNIGLPARTYDDQVMVDTFRKIGIAAANISANPIKKIHHQHVRQCLHWAGGELEALKKGTPPSEAPFMADMIEVVPEIAAQISGYIRSDSWDRQNNMMMLVDIGAGTVDASIFTVIKMNSYQFSFLGASVEPNGVMNLHRERVKWLKPKVKGIPDSDTYMAYLDDIYLPTDQLSGVPDTWQKYIPELTFLAQYGNPDLEFYERYRSQLYERTICIAKSMNPLTPEWAQLPVFLCGGGKDMTVYKRFIDKINRGQAGIRIRLVPKVMPKPHGLHAKGVKVKDYHRFSVAYGLSYSRDLIGQCIPSAQIPPFTRSRIIELHDHAVTKDMV